jgi:taurine---2-oxoglutarate transaminase
MNISSLQAKHMMQCWSAQKNYEPLPAQKTLGCWIYTGDGKKIFDLRSAHECANIGFNHPHVIRAMKDQMESLFYVTDDFATEPAALLARKLSEMAPGSPDKKVWFGQSGASAVEAAIKAARFWQYNRLFSETLPDERGRQYPFPYKIISRYRSWHGSTAGALSVSGDPRRWFTEPVNAPGVVFGPDAYPYRSPMGDDDDGIKAAEYLRYMVQMEGGSDFVAAIIVEPVVGSNGIIPAPAAYMKRVREICDDSGILMIVDETMTGMGRTGKFLAIEHYDIVPDIIVMGKALGMYCPLSACIMSEKVAAVFEENIFGHGQSYSGHALACRAALASIQVIEKEKLLEHTREMGSYLELRLNELRDKHPSVGEVRGIGLMWTLELVRNRETKEPIRSSAQKYSDNPVKQLAEYLLKEKNIYVPGDKFGLWITPPLVVTKDEIDYLVKSFDESLWITDECVGNM